MQFSIVILRHWWPVFPTNLVSVHSMHTSKSESRIYYCLKYICWFNIRKTCPLFIKSFLFVVFISNMIELHNSSFNIISNVTIILNNGTLDEICKKNDWTIHGYQISLIYLYPVDISINVIWISHCRVVFSSRRPGNVREAITTFLSVYCLIICDI